MKGELLDNNKKKNMNIRLEDEREKNKKLKMMYIIIIAVCIVAVVATGIIQIVKNLPDKEPEIDTSILQRYKEDFDNIFKNQVNYLKNSGYTIDRIDESQQIVYTGYSNKSNKVSDYNLDVNIPYINIKNTVIEGFNQDIKDTFEQKAKSILSTQSQNIIYNVEYCAYVTNDILSLVVRSTLKEGENTQREIIQTYNYNLLTQKKVTFEDLLNLKNISRQDAGNTIKSEIKSIEKTSLDDNLNYASKLLKKLNKSNINNLFRESYDKDSIVIDEKNVDKGYISVIGTHYGKVTLAPAIAKMLCDTISSNLNCKLKKNFIDKRREFYRFREMDRNEINEVIKLDKRYGKIICMCNNVSEGEIVDSIRRPLGARTVKGVKRRTGAGFGNCHGAYCNERIIQILARELDKKITDIVDDSKNSNIISGRIKEFKEI